MVRIESVSIRNFKNIEKADLKFGPLNALIGPNGSGKSNLLLFTSFLDYIINDSAEYVKDMFLQGSSVKFGDFFPKLYYNREDNREVFEQPTHIEIDFYNTELNYQYNYKIGIKKESYSNDDLKNFVIGYESFSFKKRSTRGKSITLMTQADGQITFHKTVANYFPIGKIKDLSISGIRMLDLVLKTNESLSAEYGHTINSLNDVISTQTIYLSSHALRASVQEKSSSTVEGRLIRFDLDKTIIKLSSQDIWPIFYEAAKKITGLDIEVLDLGKDLEGKAERKFVAYFHRNRFSFLRDLSDGQIILVGLIAKIVTNTSDIIFLEELENSIHPRALSDIIDLMKSYCSTKQFLISTHSTTLLNMIEPENVFVSILNGHDLAEVTMIKNVKELKRKLSHNFINFGDLLYSQEEEESFDDIF